MIKICAECGLEFETKNGMQKYCNRKHYRTCVVCGNKYEISKYHLSAKDARATCSRKCSILLRKQTNMQRYGGVAPASSEAIREKMNRTNLERYGTEHPAQLQQIKDKTKLTNRKKYGVDYYTQTTESRNNMKSLWQDEDYSRHVISAIQSTNLDKYGTKSSLGNPVVREKAKQTYFDKTGYSEPFANPDVQRKSEKTNEMRYGVKRPLQSEKIFKKYEQTNLRKYGYKNPMQSENILSKVQKTCLDRYGNTCFLQSDLGKKLTADSMQYRYGVRWHSQCEEWKLSRMIDPSKINNLVAFQNNQRKYVQENYDERPSIRILASDLGVHENTVGQILINNDCQDIVSYVYSYMETEMYNFLISLDSNMVIQRNTHKIITPYELDIYLPEYKIGIECNPTSTHNSSINTFNKFDQPMSYDYHLKKTLKCNSKGVFLFHVFGSEWTYNKQIIQSMIANLLHKCRYRIYARECCIKEIDAKTCKDFLDKNHRQGNANSKVRIGLYHEEDLVSVMTFGKMRKSIGTDGTDLSDCWELVRFCSILNTSVVGGASKLFKYFLNVYTPIRVRSFSDRAHTQGKLYEKLGFKKLRESDPGYVWVDSRTDISYHRYSAQKQNLVNFLKDDDIDLTKTEKQIMEEHGFLQVYDCGTVLWEYIHQPYISMK